MKYEFKDYTGDVVEVSKQERTESLLVTFWNDGESFEMCFDNSNIKDIEKMLEMLKEVVKE